MENSLVYLFLENFILLLSYFRPYWNLGFIN